MKAARRLAIVLSFLISYRSLTAADQPTASMAEALTLYQHGNFDAAVDMYRDLLKFDSKNSDAYARLTRTFLKHRKVEEARATVDQAMKSADSPQVRTTAGEVDFREGSISEAERQWVEVINSGYPLGRAFLGLARVSNALSLYKRAQTMLERAHEADPNDADIRKAWIRTLNRSERIQYLEEYLSQANADDTEARLHMQQYLEYLKARALAPTSTCRLVSNVTSTEASLVNLLRDPSHLRGYGLEVDFGETKAKLLLDTGAGGIVINRRIAETAGLKQISATTMGGIGDKGEAEGYIALAARLVDLNFMIARSKSSIAGQLSTKTGSLARMFFGNFWLI